MEKTLEELVDESMVLESNCLAAIKGLRELSTELDAGVTSPVMYIELMKLVKDLLAWVAKSGDMQEWTVELKDLQANAFAQVLMEHLPIGDMRWSASNKAFWIEVAEHMGPDWIAEFRKVGAFMHKVESF